jgi:hypothetical protein
LGLLDRRSPTDRYRSPKPWRFDSSFYIGALAIREAEVPIDQAFSLSESHAAQYVLIARIRAMRREHWFDLEIDHRR